MRATGWSVLSHVIKIFVVTNHISRMDEARVVKFWMHVGYVKSQSKDGN